MVRHACVCVRNACLLAALTSWLLEQQLIAGSPLEQQHQHQQEEEVEKEKEEDDDDRQRHM